MRAAALAFLFGTVGSLHLSALPGAPFLALTCLLALVVMLSTLRASGWALTWLLVGICWAQFRADLVLDAGLASELEGETQIIQGRISSVPVRVGRGLRFQVSVDSIRAFKREWQSPGRVRLTWYGRDEVSEPERVRVGERWQFSTRLRAPNGFMNPGGTDREAWFFQHRIRAVGYVVDCRLNQRLAVAAWSIDGYRQALQVGWTGLNLVHTPGLSKRWRWVCVVIWTNINGEC